MEIPLSKASKMLSRPSEPLDSAALGRYDSLAPLAETDRSLVLLAQDREAGESVVLKRFRRTDSLAFANERACGAAARHENLLGFRDVLYFPDQSPCLVFEYLAEGTLRDHLSALGPLDSEGAFRLVAQIGAALAALHATGWIHCDVKPENLFLRATEHGFDFLLGDLGAACQVSQAKARSNRYGTPAYLAPERNISGFDHRSDLYSLGVVLFEAVTGRLPYLGALNTLEAQHRQGVYSLDQIDDLRLRELIGWLLQVRPEHRPETANLVVAAATRELPSADPVEAVADTHAHAYVEPTRAELCSADGAPSLVVEHAEGLSVDALTEPKSARLQVLGGRLFGGRANGAILYGTREHIGELCLRTGRKTLLLNNCRGLSHGASTSNWLVFADASGLNRARLTEKPLVLEPLTQQTTQDRAELEQIAGLSITGAGEVALRSRVRPDEVVCFSDASRTAFKLREERVLDVFGRQDDTIVVSVTTRANNRLVLRRLVQQRLELLATGFRHYSFSSSTGTLTTVETDGSWYHWTRQKKHLLRRAGALPGRGAMLIGGDRLHSYAWLKRSERTSTLSTHILHDWSWQ